MSAETKQRRLQGRTRHVWGFAKKMDSSTKMQLETGMLRTDSPTPTKSRSADRLCTSRCACSSHCVHLTVLVALPASDRVRFTVLTAALNCSILCGCALAQSRLTGNAAARDRVESQTETGREYGGRSKESNVFGTTGLAKNPAELQEEKRLQRKCEH